MAKDDYEMYGLLWQRVTSPLWREIRMIQRGGRWKTSAGHFAGNGVEFHFKAALKILWPEIIHHRWTDLFIEHYLTKRTVVVLGPASTGKTFMAAFCGLLDYYCFPSITNVICCSTTRERLEDRVWKEVKKLHKL